MSVMIKRAVLIVDGHDMTQITWETGDREIKQVGRLLRNKGYRVVTASLGRQITECGAFKLTMMSIMPGKNKNAFIEYTRRCKS